jgi:hypothetical protein
MALLLTSTFDNDKTVIEVTTEKLPMVLISSVVAI